MNKAEDLSKEYGITQASEIDLEAIAHCENVRVQYKSMSGCEARIIGLGNKAIITINDNSIPTRQRFSLGHELGHWFNDKGCVSSLCKKESIGPSKINDSKVLWTEVYANKFASDLLMPMYLFKKSSQDADINFNTVDILLNEYATSKSATALRLIKADHYPSALVYSEGGKTKWQFKSASVPKSFYIVDHIQTSSHLHDVMFNNAVDKPTICDASAWVTVVNAQDYEIIEHSVAYYKGFLTLLWWQNESQIIDYIG